MSCVAPTVDGSHTQLPIFTAVCFYLLVYFNQHFFCDYDFSNRGGWGGGGTCIIYHTSPEGLISFSSLSSLTHSRQLIISLFPQIPQCTCNYHAHACLPQASCLEGGVSLSFSLSASLSFLPLFLAVLFPITCLFLSFSSFSTLNFSFSPFYPRVSLLSLVFL